MPETQTPPRAAAAKTPPTPRSGGRTRESAATGNGGHKPKPAIDRTEELSNEVLESIESGQRAAIDAVRKFMESIDRALPSLGEGPSKRQDVIDSTMELADRLVHTQYDFLRKVVHSAGKSLGRSD